MAKSPIRMIPLNKLTLSDLNVRKSAVSDLDDFELYASIKALGIKQNLLVHEHDGQFEVHAGGRRLKLAKRLVDEGVWADDALIACLIETREQAVESSTTENMARSAMHPADEFAAFKAMLDKGANEDTIALKFGTSPAVVRKRLSLGSLAPQIFEAFRNNIISIECAKAFTISNDHTRQLQVFEKLQDTRDLYPHNIRRTLLETTCTANSRLAIFVGLDDYKAAGGAIVEDLFSDHNSTHLKDLLLLEQLAIAKLEDIAYDLRKTWKWADVRITADFETLREYGRLYPESAEPDPALLRERDELDSQLAELAASFDENGWTEELQAKEDDMSARLEALEKRIEQSNAYTQSQRSIAGCMVSIDYHGNLKIESGLVRAKDIPVRPDERSEKCGTDQQTGEDIVVPTLPAANALKSGVPDMDDVNEPGLSLALTDELRATRNQIMKAHLATDFTSAFDLMVYTLAKRGLSGFGFHETPLEAAVSPTETFATRDALKVTVSSRMLEVIADELDLAWINLPQPHDFTAMSALPLEKKQAIFAFCSAKGLKQQLNGPKANPVIELIGQRLDIDVARFWRPTASNYWGRVTKAHSLSIARALLGDQWADDHANTRKGDLAITMETVFGDEAESRAGITPSTAARTLVWLPVGMAISAEVPEENSPDSAEDESEDDEIEPPAPLLAAE